MKSKAVRQVVIAVVLIGAAVWLFVRHFTPERSSKQVPVRCASCGYEYVPKQAEDDPACPKCGARAGWQLLYYHCNDCDSTFLAYGKDTLQGLIREPGGEWISTQAWVPVPPACPQCSSTNTTFVKPTGRAVIPSDGQQGE